MNYLRLQLAIFSFLVFCIHPVWSNDTLRMDDITQRNEIEKIYNSYYKLQPSLLSQWEYGDYSQLALGYTMQDGDYCQPQLNSHYAGIEIKGSSKVAIKNGWHFAGEVKYKNYHAETGKWNLSYRLPQNGSPFYYMQERSGKWDGQSYIFDVAFSKQLGNRFSLGMNVDYEGNLYFRYVDTRNEIYNLTMRYNPSVTYQLAENHWLGLGLSYSRDKSEPAISNKYQHGDQQDLYHIYFNQGCGVRDNSPSQTMHAIDSKYGITVSSRNNFDKSVLDLFYSFELGEESWKLKSMNVEVTTQSEVTQYTYMIHQLNSKYTILCEKARWQAEMNAGFLTGTGSVYQTNLSSFVDNYQIDRTNLNMSMSMFPIQNILCKKLNLGADFGWSRQQDTHYNNIASYSHITPYFAFQLGWKNLNIGGGVCYQYNLSASHEPNAAASNLYTVNIQKPMLAYESSSNLGVNAHVAYQFPIKNNIFEVALQTSYIKPISYNLYQDEATFSMNDNYLSIGAHLSFIF